MNETLQKIEQVLNDNPKPHKGSQSVFQFEVTGEEKYIFQLHFQDGKATIVHDTVRESDCTLSMSDEIFHKFLNGKINGAMAYMTGKLKIKGDIGKALKLENILKAYSFK